MKLNTPDFNLRRFCHYLKYMTVAHRYWAAVLIQIVYTAIILTLLLNLPESAYKQAMISVDTLILTLYTTISIGMFFDNPTGLKPIGVGEMMLPASHFEKALTKLLYYVAAPLAFAWILAATMEHYNPALKAIELMASVMPIQGLVLLAGSLIRIGNISKKMQITLTIALTAVAIMLIYHFSNNEQSIRKPFHWALIALYAAQLVFAYYISKRHNLSTPKQSPTL